MLDHILSAIGAVGNVLDLPGSSVRDALAGHNPFDQYLTPMSSDNRLSGRDLLRHYGLASHQDTWGNFAGGMAAEMALDPTNLFGAKSLMNTLRARNAATTANAGIHAANLKSLAQRADRFMPEEIARQVAIKGENGLPVRQLHGTSQVFDEFNPLKDARDNLYGPGHYHTSNGAMASEYAHEGPTHALTPNAREQLEVLRGHPEVANLPRADGTLTRMQKNFDVYERDPYNAKSTLGAIRVPEHLIDNVVTSAPKNVRMSYLDIRNPLDLRTEAGEAIYKQHSKLHDNEGIRALGYDGIVGDGGGMIPHDEVVAFQPSQVYKPYIAKEIQPLKPVPPVKGKSLGLLHYNALARTRRPKE